MQFWMKGGKPTFHFTEISAVMVELLVPGLSSSRLFLASLLQYSKENHKSAIFLFYRGGGLQHLLSDFFYLNKMYEEAGFLGLLGSSAFFFSSFFFFCSSFVFYLFYNLISNHLEEKKKKHVTETIIISEQFD